MRTRQVFVGIGVLLMSCAVGTSAQTPSSSRASPVDPVNGLTLADAIRQAMAQEPTLAARRLDADAAVREREQAARRPNPRLTLGREQQVGGADSVVGVETMWDLETFRRPARVAVADRATEVAARSVDETRRQIALAVARAYGDVLVADAELRIADEVVTILEQAVSVVAARVSNGASPPLDRNIAEVELLRARASRFPREAALDRARIALGRAMGQGPTVEVRVHAGLKDVVTAIGIETGTRLAKRRAVADRADVRVAHAEALLAAARVGLAKSQGRPDYALSAGYARSRAGFPLNGLSPTGAVMPIEQVFHAVSFGVTVGLPLLNRNQGGVAAAEALEARTRRLETARTLDAEADVAAAVATHVRARDAVQVFTAGLSDLARRNLDVVRESYTLGAATLTDVLQEQRRYVEVEEARVSALAEAYAASVAVLGALGELP